MSRHLVRWSRADDEGATAILLAVSFLVIIGFMALVIDYGMVTVATRRLQSAVDAGALAGCEQYIQQPGFPGEAVNVSRDYTLRHANGPLRGLTAGEVTVNVTTPGGVPTLKVTAQDVIAVPFGGVFGRASTTVRATAKAEGQRLSGARYVAPFAITVPGGYNSARFEVRTEAGSLVSSGTLTPDATGLTWTGSYAAPATPARYSLYVTYVNSAGLTEGLWDTSAHGVRPACAVFTRGSGQPVTAVSANGPLFVQMMDPSQPDVYSAYWPTVTATVSGTTASVLGRASTPDGHANRTGNVMVGGQLVGYVHAQRMDMPIKNVTVTPVVADPGQSVQVTVRLNGYDVRHTGLTVGPWGPQTLYFRSGESAAYSGDVVELNLDSVSHTTCGASAFSTAGMTGLDRVSREVKGYPGVVHVGDEIPLYASVYNYGLNGYNVRRADNRIYAHIPVVVRLSASRVRVIGFVTATIEPASYGVLIQALRFSGDYTATPHEFASAHAPVTGVNEVLAARLVRP